MALILLNLVPTSDLDFYIGQSDTTAVAFSDAGFKQASFGAGYAILEKEITLGGTEPFTIDGWVSSGILPVIIIQCFNALRRISYKR